MAKHWIQSALNPAHKGDFTAFAKRLKMSVKRAAEYVLAHQDRYDKKRVGQARFALAAQGGIRKK